MNEHKNRLKGLQDYLKREEIDIGMVTLPANVFYYTGFHSDPKERFMALIIDNRSDTYHLFVPALDVESAASQQVVESIIPVADHENPIAMVKENLGGNPTTFGFEMKNVSVFRYKHLMDAFPDARFVDIQPAIDSQRLKKSTTERTKVQQAVDIIEKVLADGIKKVRIGMSEAELTAELEYLMRVHGADGPSFSTIVLSGEKSALPHGSPGERKFQKGDFLLIDFGVHKDGYCSDITRTFVIGEASEKQKEIYAIVLQANQAGIDAVQAGAILNTFDHAARNVIEHHGYGEFFHNRVGHGLGIEVHEEPSIHSGNTDIAEKGLLFTIEPGIYIPAFGGVRIEDDVFINNTGEVEVLTSFPKELHIL